MERKRKIQGFLLLAVLLPALLCTSFHHHHPAQLETCVNCAQHLPHSGHLSTSFHLGDCLICQFAGAMFLATTAPDISCLHRMVLCVRPAAQDFPVFLPIQTSATRAPPVLFFA